MSNKEIKLKDRDATEVLTFTIKDWNIEQLTGYEPKTSFYRDFSIADKYGIDAIMDTYQRAFNEWQNDTEFITELTMVLNWKIWEHYDSTEDEDSPTNKIASLYNDLWQECDNWCRDNLKGDDLSYFYNTTD